ncbi:uncharacterized protein LOC127243563 [Andrographis paniculata]|uniref:uncharacterized protein LOC127243563 n=1 Tax=Andrographis paniculata TaxID=175694 RepID=UPI0021E728FD|nr:uncharacterized protein LOC127243563 [Andrographis paniculata]
MGFLICATLARNLSYNDLDLAYFNPLLTLLILCRREIESCSNGPNVDNYQSPREQTSGDSENRDNDENEGAELENEDSDDDTMFGNNIDAMEKLSALAINTFTNATARRRCYDSALSGAEFTKELINGHPARIKNLLRVSKSTFLDLCDTLSARALMKTRAQTRVGVHEAVAIFLHTVAHSNRHRSSAEQFQHSTHTIFRHVKRVSESLCLLGAEVVCPKDQHRTHPRIATNRHFMPYFKDCVGALDETLIHAAVPAEDAPCFRSRMGDTEQSVLGVAFPPPNTAFISSINGVGKYYLGDSAYTNSALTLTHFRSHRYYSQTFRDTLGGPNGPKELFNYCHSQLRNVVERAFGVLKRRFAILRGLMRPYKFFRQVNLVHACVTVHNFTISNGENIESHDGEGSDPTADQEGSSVNDPDITDTFLALLFGF